MSKGHILVVEDHPDNQQLVTWILEDEEYEVSCADTAEDGIRMLESDVGKYKAVLMDISLPGMDGKQATQTLRANPQFEGLPIFALTAHALESEQKSILQSGVTGLLTKPIDEEQLIACLDGLEDA